MREVEEIDHGLQQRTAVAKVAPRGAGVAGARRAHDTVPEARGELLVGFGRVGRKVETEEEVEEAASPLKRGQLLAVPSEDDAGKTIWYTIKGVQNQGERIIGKVRVQPSSPSQQPRAHRHS